MCCGMDLFVWDSSCFLDLDVRFVPQFGKFTAIIFSNKFFASFSLFSPSGAPIMWILVHLMSWRSLKLSSVLKILFSFCCSDQVISTTLSSRSLSVLLYYLICFWFLPVFFISFIVCFSCDWYCLIWLKFSLHLCFSWVRWTSLCPLLWTVSDR